MIRTASTQECGICQNVYNLKREHCPACGAKRVFIATHSFEPNCTVVAARNAETGRPLVRAFRSDFAFSVTAR